MGSVAEISDRVPDCCKAERCDRDGCRIHLNGVPASRVIIDMDCGELGIDNEKRCDYLFVGEEGTVTWIAPIELKGGKVGGVTKMADQIRGGVRLADRLLPMGRKFRLVPVLAHEKPIHRRDRKQLRREKVSLRGSRKLIKIVRCGDQLVKALDND